MDVRERLRDLADEAPLVAMVPASLLPRARRRIARNSVAAAVALAVVVAGTFAGVRALGSAPPRPAVKPTLGLFDRIHGWIVYQEAPQTGSRLIATDPNHPSRHVLLDHGGPINYPIEWSHDGSHLLLHRLGGGEDGLLVMDASGSITRVTDHSIALGSLSPDGSQVVYGGDNGLYVVDSTGGAPRLLARDPRHTAFVEPDWSPDGTEIAFLGGSWLWVMNADGTRPRRLVDLSHLRGDYGGRPLWSPDGSRLLFYYGYNKIWRFYVVGADGSGLHPITRFTGAFVANWSPDGSRIGIISRGRLETMAPDGTGVTASRDPVPAVLWWAWNPVMGR